MYCQTEASGLGHFHETAPVGLCAQIKPKGCLEVNGWSTACSHGLKEEHARFFFQQIILAIDYCHKMKVSNR